MGCPTANPPPFKIQENRFKNSGRNGGKEMEK